MAESRDNDTPVSLFYSYSHKDEELREELERHLAVLRRAGLISEWHDRMIGAGDDWKGEIDRSLVTANIVLLLVSADFIASDYCWGEEMTKALERHARGEARVIPVILRHCQWQMTPLGRIQGVPRDGKPVMAWLHRDEAFDDVTAAIAKAVTEMRRSHVSVQSTSAPAHPKPAAVKPAFPADFEVFHDIDAPWCPQMVALPAGEFLMGSPENEEGRNENEGPQHLVTVSRFAIGRYPITVGEYRRFVEASGYTLDPDERYCMEAWSGKKWQEYKRKSWRDPGFDQTDRHPVVGINSTDTWAYAEWLSKMTDRRYRLPMETEWEYACRAGTTTRFSFGDWITAAQANYGWTVGKTTQVGCYDPNPWGLHDMHGTVEEWLFDVYHENYEGAPTEGLWFTEKDKRRKAYIIPVIRGGNWHEDMTNLRSAKRESKFCSSRTQYTGFRVARTLE